MISKGKYWLEQVKERRRMAIYSDAWDEASDNPSPKHMRKWSDMTLHRRINDGSLSTAASSMAEREQRRREAWAAPAGRAFYVSMGAFIVAAAALVVSLLR